MRTAPEPHQPSYVAGSQFAQRVQAVYQSEHLRLGLRDAPAEASVAESADAAAV